MPSERRLHPVTLLFDLAGHVKRFAVPAVLVVVGMSSSTGVPGGRFRGAPDGWELWLLILFVPATLLSIARYLSFRLRYDEHELVIRSGLVFRHERHIPFSRIQNVDAVQNIFHRLFCVVEVRVETGGGKEEEARLSVLPRAAFDEMRSRVFGERSLGVDGIEKPSVQGDTLLHLPLREVLLCGLLENKGMVLVGAAAGVGWETGLIDRVMGVAVESSGAVGRGFFRDLAVAVFDDGPMPVGRMAIAVTVLLAFLLLVRVLSMAWGFVRLYDFRLTRAGEDLRTEYGLLTMVSATVPLRRIQAITIAAGPLHRLLNRATVRVATAGGAGNQQAAKGREWLAPLIRQEALPPLLRHIVPGFDLAAVTWQPLHPRAFARAVKPAVLFAAIATVGAALVIGWAAIGVLMVALPWSIISTRQYVAHLAWAESDEVVMMRSGWIWRQMTLARVNKIQAVATHRSPFDRRAAMARVRVDTAGAGEFAHRVDITYLDQQVAEGLANRLSASAASTAFRW